MTNLQRRLNKLEVRQREERLSEVPQDGSLQLLLDRLKRIRERIQPAIDSGEMVLPIITVAQAKEMLNNALEESAKREKLNLEKRTRMESYYR